jgi:hypothetical protein
MKKLLVGLAALCLLDGGHALGQRAYKAHSVLSSGTWYKIGITAPGVYKMDLTFLKTLGISAGSIPSSAIRLFGNGGAMLGEAGNAPYADDLTETALQVVDGGAGVLGAGSYVLFYAPGPNPWTTDSVARTFHHQKNLYSDTAYYFLTISSNLTVGGTALRVSAQVTPPAATITVNTYQDHQFHELDSLNFLASGKAWYGEEMADMPGVDTTLTFSTPIPGLVQGGTLSLATDVVARSIGTPGIVNVGLNDSLVQTHTVPATGNGAYDLFAYEDSLTGTMLPASGDSLKLRFTFSSSGLDAQAWLNWWEMVVPRQLNFEHTGQFTFRDWKSVAQRQEADFQVGGAGATSGVWEVTNASVPVQMRTTFSGSQLQFVNDATRLREYVAFTAAGALTPKALGVIPSQDLHGGGPADLLIITYPSLVAQAEQLLIFHKAHDSLRVQVVTTNSVFNEFASGTPDPTAMRDFVKMYYDRAGTDTLNRPRYLLFLGDGSYDYKHRIPGNDNLVPVYESLNSLDPLSTYTSDDYFGFLKDADNINNPNMLNLLDIGIGRIPAANTTDAQSAVNKVLSYNNSRSMGPWRMEMTYVADDGDQNLHLQDAESISATAAQAAPADHIDKIYLDAYPEQATSGGGRYPAVVEAINGEMYTGTLTMNYNGHGGSTRLSNEDILDATTISAWQNATHLPLLITATCNFAPYDDPQTQSLGEKVVLQPQTGAIALMTTTRDVFAFSNLIINNNYVQAALQPNATGIYPSLGTAVKNAKNYTYTTYSDIANNRKFTLLGDPALTLAYPRGKAAGLTVNGTPVRQDTLKALNKYTLTGQVNTPAGQLQAAFNGTAYVTVYDKPAPVQTRANNPGSLVTTFLEQNSIIYNGKASVTGGKFQLTFVVPKDIDYTLGKGKITYYADNGLSDAGGADSIWIGGTGANTLNDHTGPVIQAYLNDNQFVNGGITNQTPLLLLNLFDSSGINTTGSGVGHDISAVLDDNTASPFILDKYYEAATNSYQKGSVQFPLPAMTPGFHTLSIKAWDVADNSTQVILTFVVEGDTKLVLSHVLNYPNPFTTHTQFWFEHNRPGEPLEVSIRIFTVTGKIIKEIRKTIISTGDRSTDLDWDGRDDFGNKIGKGVYLFDLQVRTTSGQVASAMNKMVLL